MTFKDFLTAFKEIMIEVNGLLKATIATAGLMFVAYNVYKQVSTIKEPTPAAIIGTVCGAEVIDSLNIASKLADPATGAVIEELLVECQKIKPPEPPEPDKAEPPQVQFPVTVLATVPVDVPTAPIPNVPLDIPAAKQIDTKTLNVQ